MKNFLSALRFLTIIPIPLKTDEVENPGPSLVYFPVVGFIIGGVLALVSMAFAIFGFESILSSAIVVIIYIIITGGLHLDGLSDTFDGLAAGKDREETLRIMHEPTVGAYGVLAIVSAVILKILFIASINASLRPHALIAMCVLSKWAFVLSLYFFPYAKPSGKAKVFTEAVNRRIFLAATAIALFLSVVMLKIAAIPIFFIIGLAGYLFNKSLEKKIGGITGDTLGAYGEISELIALFLIYTFATLGR